MDIEQIKLWHKTFYPNGGLFEIRLLHGENGKNWSGYFKDIDTMVKALAPIVDATDKRYIGNPQAYFTLNEISDALYNREQHDKFIIKAQTTTDNDIIRRKFVLLDFDAERPAGISSSNEELKKSVNKALKVYNFLKRQGFKEPVSAFSGNGCHLLYRVDMPNDEDHNNLVKAFIEALAKMFPGEGVDIDCKVFNPARICKLYGTEARKGANTADRPWRMAEIKRAPKPLEVNEDSLFNDVALMMPQEEEKSNNNRSYQNFYDGERFDLVAWLDKYCPGYRVKENSVFTIYQLKECPNESSHSSHHPYESAIFQNKSTGVISFSCWHDHCKNLKWHDIRLIYEPNAYDNKGQYKPYAPAPKPRFEYKQETEDKGHKWLALSQIQRVDWDSLEKVKTGFDEIDRSMLGLFMGDVTVLSGTNGSGKSSWLNTLILNVIENQYKVALWSGELQASDVKMWLEQVAAGPNYVVPSKKYQGFYSCPKNVGLKIDAWLDKKFALYNSEYGAQWQQVFEDMKKLREKDVRFFVVDNLMALDIDLLDGDKNQQQKKVITDIKNFAKASQSHIILVAHPRKGLGRGKMSLLRKDDIAGTADLSNMVDNVFIIHRKNEDFLKGIADYFGKERAEEFRSSDFGNYIEVCKSRRFGVIDKFIGLYYDTPSRRFTGLRYNPNSQQFEPNNTVKEYGWDHQGVLKSGNNQFSIWGETTQDDNDPLGAAANEITGDIPF